MGRIDLANAEEKLAKALAGFVLAAIEYRVGRAITARGNINADAIAGIVPVRSGGTGNTSGIRDHNHDGTKTQKLAEANTHEGVILGPTADAIHWDEAALLALIEAHAGAFDPDAVRDAGRWEAATNGDPDYPELLFADGDALYIWVEGTP